MKAAFALCLVACAAAAPVIHIIDGERQVYAASATATYHDAGATCTDNGATLNVTVAGDHDEVHLGVAGTYSIEYYCTGADTIANATRTVVVEPMFKDAHQAALFSAEHGRPVLTLNEGMRQYFQQEPEDSDFHWVDAGAHCTYNGKDISNKVSIMGQTVRLTEQGVYKIVYNCQAADGNTAVAVQREVLVGPRVDDFRQADVEGHSNFQGGNDWNQEDKRLRVNGVDSRIARDAAERAALAAAKGDLSKPIIKLNGAAQVHLEVNAHDVYHDLGATCFFDGEDVSQVMVKDQFGHSRMTWNLTPHSKTIRLNVPGKYTVDYHCHYDDQDAEVVKRTVVVASTVALSCTTVGMYVTEDDTCDNCPAGTYGKLLEPEIEGHAKVLGCVPCAEGSIQPNTGATSCTPLADSEKCTTAGHFTNAITGECEQCKAFTMEQGNQCVDCPIGQWSAAGASSCTFSECAPGTFQKADGTCENCEAGRYQALGYDGSNNDQWGRSFCFKCPEGTFNFEVGQTECADGASCAAGHRVVATGANNAYTCEQCPIGYAQDKASKTDCNHCDAGEGQYAPFEGMTQCVQSKCKPGYYSRQFATAKQSLKDLVAAEQLVNRDSAMLDHEHLYEEHDGFFELCTMCDTNEFQDLAGQPSCKACDDGFYAGFGWTKCSKTSCGAGTYQKTWTVSGQTHTRCVECPINTYSTGVTTACTACPTGEYTPKTGSTSCESIQCEAGEYQDSRYSQKMCHKCRPGTYSEGPATACLPCTGDRWTFVEGSTSCTYATSCSVGRYWKQADEECQDCPVGKYTADQNQAKCDDCPVGKYQFSAGQNTCNSVTCGAGKYMSKSWGNCMDCSPGTYSATGGLTYCYKCQRGKYTYNAGATQCTDSQCQAGTYQSRLAIPVDGTTTGETTTCHKCPWNTYQPLAKMFYCFKCPTGKFAHGTGKSKCTTKKLCFKTHNGVFCANTHNRRSKDEHPVSTCQNIGCKVVPHAGHMKMQVTHVPAHRTGRGMGFTAGSQEPAEERIMATQSGDDFFTAHHLCKSNYKTSTASTEQGKRDDCSCICW